MERAELIQLLRTGGSIEAFCMDCDCRWDLSAEEHGILARALNK
jgi:hypothetical protein